MDFPKHLNKCLRLGHSLNLWIIESSFFTHTIALRCYADILVYYKDDGSVVKKESISGILISQN